MKVSVIKFWQKMIEWTYNQKQIFQEKMKNPFMKNLNTRVPVWIAVNTGTQRITVDKNKVIQMYQNFTNAIISDMSRKTVAKEPREKVKYQQ